MGVLVVGRIITRCKIVLHLWLVGEIPIKLVMMVLFLSLLIMVICMLFKPMRTKELIQMKVPISYYSFYSDQVSMLNHVWLRCFFIFFSYLGNTKLKDKVMRASLSFPSILINLEK